MATGGLLEEVTLELGVEGLPSVSVQSFSAEAVAFYDCEYPQSCVFPASPHPLPPPGDSPVFLPENLSQTQWVVWAGNDTA